MSPHSPPRRHRRIRWVKDLLLVRRCFIFSLAFFGLLRIMKVGRHARRRTKWCQSVSPLNFFYGPTANGPLGGY